jgi:hypothetical protein
VKDLFGSANSLWSLGFSVAQVVFDAGAIAANVDSAKAGYESSVARYRQTVLTAFQAVEDQLTASAALAQQEGLRREASAAADKTEQQLLNRYRAAQVSYTDVVTAQAAALSARRTLVQLQVNRQTTAIALIQAMGGGWQAGWMGEGNANAEVATATHRLPRAVMRGWVCGWARRAAHPFGPAVSATRCAAPGFVASPRRAQCAGRST